MTPEEIRAVVRAAQQADGGCPYCCREVLQSLAKSLPAIDWLAAYNEARLADGEPAVESLNL